MYVKCCWIKMTDHQKLLRLLSLSFSHKHASLLSTFLQKIYQNANNFKHKNHPNYIAFMLDSFFFSRSSDTLTIYSIIIDAISFLLHSKMFPHFPLCILNARFKVVYFIVLLLLKRWKYFIHQTKKQQQQQMMRQIYIQTLYIICVNYSIQEVKSLSCHSYRD